MEWELKTFPGKEDKKTLSLLFQGLSGILPVVAKSGYSHWDVQHDPDDKYSPINGVYYTKMTTSLYESLNFKIDGYQPSGFYACHSEALLITWFVEKYFPYLLEEYTTGSREELSQPPRHVLILSNRKPCEVCEKFAEHVKNRTEVDIVVEYREPNSPKGTRRPM